MHSIGLPVFGLPRVRNLTLRYPVIVVRNLSSIQQIGTPEIKELVQQRLDDLGGDAFDADELGYFLVVESSDTSEALSGQLGFDLLRNRISHARYGQPDFTPLFEFVEEFPFCYDMVFVLSDDGFGVELFIPKGEDIDTELIAMCRQFAFRSEDEAAP